MKRMRPWLLLLGFAGLAIATAAFAWRGKVDAPQTFERQFTATGLVEEVRAENRGRCTVRVAVYDWISLSQGFAVGEIPKRSDRYDLRGEGDLCDSLSVTMASSSGHIAFEAGFASGAWHFAEAPAPGLGCGGLEIDWTPDPL